MSRYVRALLNGGFACLLLAFLPVSLYADDYSLADLYRIALSQSEQLKIAQENVAIADIGTDRARSFLLPRVTAIGVVVQYSQKKFSDSGSIIQPETTSSWGGRIDQT